MTGFNMPPGCSPSDIPGNGPGDGAEEALVDGLENALKCAGISTTEDQFEMLSLWYLKQISDAIGEGWNNCAEQEALCHYLASIETNNE